MAQMDTARRRPRTAVTGAATPKAPPKKVSTQKLIAQHLESVHSKVVASVTASLTSAAALVEPGEKGKLTAPEANAVARTWQHAVYGYSRSVPELSAAQIYVGNCLSRCQLVVGKRDPDGTVEQGFDGEEPVEGLDPKIADEAADLIADLRSGSGGQSELLRRFGEQMFLVGEMYLLPIDEPYGISWEALSTSELTKSESGAWMINNGPGMGETTVEPDSVPIRVWRPDSQYRKLASSSVRSCMEILEELVILTRLVRSSAISRIALAGILVIAEEFDGPDDDVGEDGQTAEQTNPLAVDMMNTGSKAIDDPASAAAWMPYILQVQGSLVQDGIKHIALAQDGAEHVVKRQEAVERLARGLDLPVEATMGHQQTTFANAMQVSADVFNIHLAPMLQLLCDGLTVGYLWPAMAKARGLDPERVREAGYPEEILMTAVTYDARKLVSRPDRAKEIVEAFKDDKTEMLVSHSEVREAIGLDPEGGPDDDEVAARLDAIRQTNIRETIRVQAEGGSMPVTEPTDQDLDVLEQGIDENLTAAGLAQRIAAAAELTADRACEKVGAKLKSTIKTKPSYDAMRQVVADAPNQSVARIIGPEVTTRLLGSADPITAELAAFHRLVRRWAAEAKMVGPDGIADRAMDFMATRIRLQLFGDSLVTPPSEFVAMLPKP